MRVKQSDLDPFIATSAAKGQAAKVQRYQVGLSDRATLAAPAPSESTREVWVCAIEAAGPDQAVSRAIRQWHSEVGDDAVPRSITVSLVER